MGDFCCSSSRPTSTPTARARSGTMCPGRVKSEGVAVGSARARTVRARSPAEMPVVVPTGEDELRDGTLREVRREMRVGRRSRKGKRWMGIDAYRRSHPAPCHGATKPHDR